MNLDELAATASAVYADAKLPKPLDALVALRDVRRGGTTLKSLHYIMRNRVATLDAHADPVQAAFEVDLKDLPTKVLQKAKKGELMVGQLIIGTLAEQAFEAIYRERLGKSEFKLDDYRGVRNDTDYRVLNGGGRPLFRINSKFHGSRFRQAKDMVGLEPEDCFPLATYKIWSARQKEDAEHLPYLFLVISTPITAESVAAQVPENLRTLVRYVHASGVAEGKRTLEERIVSLLLKDPTFEVHAAKWRIDLSKATWRVFSARRAEKLLREKLWERVFAVRTRNFTQAFRNAELDMHFSLSVDMTPLDDLLSILAKEGSQAIVGRCTAGVM